MKPQIRDVYEGRARLSDVLQGALRSLHEQDMEKIEEMRRQAHRLRDEAVARDANGAAAGDRFEKRWVLILMILPQRCHPCPGGGKARPGWAPPKLTMQSTSGSTASQFKHI